MGKNSIDRSLIGTAHRAHNSLRVDGDGGFLVSEVDDAPAEPSVLYVCSTPIGNLGDITLRALDILRSVDWIAAEDTRVTRKLLAHYDIHARLKSYHEHNRTTMGPKLIGALESGESGAVVTDAGTPGLSDPGADLVRLAVLSGVEVRALPGASALLAAVAISGIPCDRFVFEGFLPRSGTSRKQRLTELATDARAVVIYEAPHRLLATLRDLSALFGERPAAVCRELTKKFEEVRRGNLTELIRHFSDHAPRGEFVIVLGQATPAKFETREWDESELGAHVEQRMQVGMSKKEAVAAVAQELGVPRRDVYRAAVHLSAYKDDGRDP